jgi:DNA-binding transcriptional regulator YiaG
MKKGGRSQWSPGGVKGLRQTLRLSQSSFASELGVRQQTVSDWETGIYAPRGASARLLEIVAERAGYDYSAPPRESDDSNTPDGEGGA